MSEIAAMQAAHTPESPDSPPPHRSLDEIEAASKSLSDRLAAKRPIPERTPIPHQVTFTVEYTNPQTGERLQASVPHRVLLKSDERQLVFRVAADVLGMDWGLAPMQARNLAYEEAVCRVQWERDASVPQWFKDAYLSDPGFASVLADHAGAHTDSYFRGLTPQGDPDAAERFVVQCPALLARDEAERVEPATT